MGLSELFGSTSPFAGGLSAIRAVAALVIIFFLPGFAWTLVLFSGINVIERIALSFGLSLAMVTLSVIALNILLHVRITGTNSLIIIILITAIALAIYVLKRFVLRKKTPSDGD